MYAHLYTHTHVLSLFYTEATAVFFLNLLLISIYTYKQATELMADAASTSALPREEAERDACAPALLHLSPALPSSLANLGLAFPNAVSPATPPATTAAVPTMSPIATTTHTSSAAAAAAADSTRSFRVRAMHFDDVAQDVILVCEENITLFVPLHCDVAADASTQPTDEQQQQQRQQAAKDNSAPTPAVAACLRLGNPNQAWVPVPSQPTPPSPSSLSGSVGTASVGMNCLPRRLPLPAEELRRASSVLVAVPILSLSSSATSAAAASSSSSAFTTPAAGGHALRSTVMSIVVVECAVLPDGVDFIEPKAVPLARPLRRILCAPNTFRFREAWYPIQYFCWCGPPTRVAREAAHTAAGRAFRDTASSSPLTTPHQCHRHASQRNTDADDVKEEAEEEQMSSCRYTDYHLLCVSSICVDLLRIRHKAPSVVGHAAPAQERVNGSQSSHQQPDIAVMMNAGYAQHPPPQPQPSSTASMTAAARAAFTASAVALKVLQRYVTRTDWCTYESRSRVLLCVNYSRPDVLKPMTVEFEPACSTAASQSLSLEGPAGASADSAAASAGVSLCKWSELTLPENLCASLNLRSTSHALPHDARVARLLHSVVGVFTAYSQTFFYHVPTWQATSITASGGGGVRAACMDLYLYQADDVRNGASNANGGSSLSSSPTSPSPFPSSSLGCRGAATAMPHGNNSSSSTDDRSKPAMTTTTSTASSPTDFFKRLTVAASFATASAAPPDVRSGVFVKVAQLSLQELLLPSLLQTSPLASPAQPLPQVQSLTSPTSTTPTTATATATERQPSASSLSHGGSQQRHVWPPPVLSLQIWNDLILLHHLGTGKSAVYDLAERPFEGDDERVPARDYLLWATASERSRRWAWIQHARRTAASSSFVGGRNSSVGRASSSRAAATAAVSAASAAAPTTTATSAHGVAAPYSDSRSGNARSNTSHQLWARAMMGDWTSMVSTMTNSAIELSGAAETSTGSTAAAPWTDTRVPQVLPLCCCVVTANGAAKRTAKGGVGAVVNTGNRAAEGISQGEGNDESDLVTRKVLYPTCVWPSSSRAPVVISKHDGSVRLCQVNVVAVAEWLLLLQNSRTSTSSFSSPPADNHRGRAAQSSVTDASLCQLVAFACRHPSSASYPCPSPDFHASGNKGANGGEMHKDDEESTHDSDGVSSIVTLLGGVASYLVLGELRTAPPPPLTASPQLLKQSSPGSDDFFQSKGNDSSTSYGAALQRHLSSVLTMSSSSLFSLWSAMVETLTIEVELVDRFAGASQQQRQQQSTRLSAESHDDDALAYTAAPRSAHHGSSLHHSANMNKSFQRRWRGARLQSLFITHVWMPIWRDAKSLKGVTELAESSKGRNDDPQQSEHEQQPQAAKVGRDEAPPRDVSLARQRQSRRLRRCEELLCGYVRLLRRLALPILPALQELLLEVVLRCDLDTGSIMLEEALSAPLVNTTHAGNTNAESICCSSVDVLTATASRTARRVRELLRQGVLEENSITARSLLGWWERFRYQLAAAQEEAKDGWREERWVEVQQEVRRASRRDEGSRHHSWTTAQAGFLSDGGCPEAETLFQEAVRLFTLHGHLLEVAEAYRWRHQYTAAAAVLLYMPRDTPPIELCEVHGSRRGSTSSATTPNASSSSSLSAAATAVLRNAKSTPRRTSRLLSWDTLAVAVLDGAWNAVREAEERCYVLAERAAAAVRSAVPEAGGNGGEGGSLSSPFSSMNSPLVSPSLPQWQLRAAEHAVQAAHRLYLSVATSILTLPGLTLVTGGEQPQPPLAPSLPPPPPTLTTAAAESTTEFNPSLARESIRGAHPHHPHRYNPINSNVSAGYHAHEVRYAQLRQQVETDWRHLKAEGVV